MREWGWRKGGQEGGEMKEGRAWSEGWSEGGR